MLRENLDELQQTISLIQSDNHEEFFDISIRNKKYGRVDALNGPMLLEKYICLLVLQVWETLTNTWQDLPPFLRARLRAPLSQISRHDLA